MHTYKRNTATKLTLLRTAFFLSASFCVYLFQMGKADYGVVLLFLLACGLVFPVTSVVITLEALSIRQYYVYGIFHRSWHFQKNDNIDMQTFDLEVSDAGYLHTDEWWDAFFTFWPTSQLKIKKYIIKHTDVIGNKTQIKIKLSQEELSLIQTHYQRNNYIHKALGEDIKN